MAAVTVDFDAFDDSLRLASDAFYVLLHASAADLVGLAATEEAEWAQRASLAVGETTLGRSFWAAGDTPGKVTLLLGEDDETWDVAITLDVTTVAEIVRQARESLEDPA